MTIPNALPPLKREILEQITHVLRQTPGVVAVVLGGSYARGTHHAASDLDIGLYYYEAAPFVISDIKRVAEALAIDPNPVVTNFYEWGAWVNGGAWIYTKAGKVDFLYRNLDHVQRTITEAQQGSFHHDYNQQPAYGFYSMIYLAETQICCPLFDSQEQIAALKRQVITYPPKLKARVIGDCLWSAEFTLLHAQSFAAAGDVYNTVGCLTRMADKLTQVLFALNEVYFMSDKRVMDLLSAFAILPVGYIDRIQASLAHPGATVTELQQTVDQMAAAWQSVAEYARDLYQPKFILKKW